MGCCGNVAWPSATLARHWLCIVSTSHVNIGSDLYFQNVASSVRFNTIPGIKSRKFCDHLQFKINPSFIFVKSVKNESQIKCVSWKNIILNLVLLVPYIYGAKDVLDQCKYHLFFLKCVSWKNIMLSLVLLETYISSFEWV